MPTEQEQFWSGPAGDAYTARNHESLLAAKTALLKRITEPLLIDTVIEFGANRGLNLIALNALDPDLELAAVEINRGACEKLQSLRSMGIPIEVWNQSLLTFAPLRRYDLSIAMGVLIHIHPDDLSKAYEALYRASSRYILLCEYFSRNPIAITYRGEEGLLWARDYGGEMLDRYPDLHLLDYGFVSRRDPVAPLDDVTWWLLSRTG